MCLVLRNVTCVEADEIRVRGRVRVRVRVRPCVEADATRVAVRLIAREDRALS